MVYRVEFCRGFYGQPGYERQSLGDQEWEKVQLIARANGWQPERADYKPGENWRDFETISAVDGAALAAALRRAGDANVSSVRALLADGITQEEYEQVNKPALGRFAEIFEAGRAVDFAWDD